VIRDALKALIMTDFPIQHAEGFGISQASHSNPELDDATI
jgi:hypothetical protein